VAHDRTLGDCLVLIDDLFDFARPDLVPSAVDHVFETIDEIVIPVVVAVANITAVEPTVAHGFTRLLLALVIPAITFGPRMQISPQVLGRSPHRAHRRPSSLPFDRSADRT